MKSVVCIIFMMTCHLASAQFVKGDKLVGGGYSVSIQNSSSGNDGDHKLRSLTIYPNVGFFLNERYAVGGGLSYGSTSNKYSYSQGSYQHYRDRGIGIHGFVKGYFPIAEKFFFSIQGSLGYNRGRSTVDNGSSETKQKSYSIHLDASPSLAFFPSPNWAIEGGIGNLGIIHSRGLLNDAKSTSFGLNYGGFSVGFAYFFRSSVE